jgi:oligopeptide transport system permease protein
MAVAQGAVPVSLTDAQKAERPRSALRETWQQFRRRRLATYSLVFMVLLVLLAISADALQAVGLIDDPTYQHRGSSRALPWTCTVDPARMSPQWCFISGADTIGRDVLTRVIYGARVSLLVGFIGAATAMTFGVFYGVVSGYYGGRLDNLMQRFIEFLNSIPGLPLIIVFKTVLSSLEDYRATAGPFLNFLIDLDRSVGGLLFLFIVLGLTSWTGVARIARGQVLSYKNKEFVDAARSMGARDRRIITAHLLPNILGPLILIGCQAIPGFIGAEAALSYLGIGVRAPTPSWGDMIAQGQAEVFGYPHLFVLATLMLGLTILSFNYIADGLRDALDPSMRGL